MTTLRKRHMNTVYKYKRTKEYEIIAFVLIVTSIVK